MSNPAVSPQHEPTMEEILASIRKIIADDQPEAAKPAADPEPVQAAEPVAVPAPVAEEDVLELTEEVSSEEPASEPLVMPEPPPPMHEESDIEFGTPAEPAPSHEGDAEGLLSDSTRSAIGDAFSAMNQRESRDALPAGSLDAVFIEAVQSAFRPAINEWILANRAEILDAMKPMIRSWMDENLPPLVASVIAKEVARLTEENSRKR